jgi:LuxR family maltose regulon positive regulatory protein
MTTPLLATKLYIPPTRLELVHRSRLIEQLNAGLSWKFTLISAPAGFGKTTLLSAWAEQSARPLAWLTLDDEDNNPARFLAYFVSAIQSVGVDLNIDPQSLIQSRQLPPIDNTLTLIINSIAAAQTAFILVLDDYHLIETSSIHQALNFFLEQLPYQNHLVIATRADPDFPLARLRGRGQINELRAKDLRFTVEETSAFVQQVVGADISPEQIAALNTSTEGWIAGLQMAAVSMRGVDDIPAFISTFSGNHRYIVDYLVDEVLAQCSSATRDFLLQTSILERMTAPLCDSLTGRSDSQTTLEWLEQDNLFTIPLDQRREWYRYHHLFADLLCHKLQQTYPDRIEELHARASQWMEGNGFLNQSINHALELVDKHRAANLIERHAKTLLYRGYDQVQNLLAWYDLLPEELIRARPLLSVFQAWTLVFDSPFKNFTEIEKLLAHTRKSLGDVDLDTTTKNTVSGHIASMQGLLSQPPVQTDHDPHTVLAYLQEAQNLYPPEEHEFRSNNFIGMGYEYMHLEDTEAALEANKNAFAEAQTGGNHLVAIVSLRNQALIAYYLGNLSQALDICQKGIASFDRFELETGHPYSGLGILIITMGYMLLEGGELQKAEIELAKGFDLIKWNPEYESLAIGHIAQTRLLILQGDGEKALQVLDRFERRRLSFAPLVDTLRIQVELSRFNRDMATQEKILAWMREVQPGFGTESEFRGISPWAETQHLSHITWIQSQIILNGLESEDRPRSNLHTTLEYLDQRLQSAQQRGLVFRSVECAVLKTLVLQALGDTEEALVCLSHALVLAEPEGFQRVFLDKGQSMRQLLRAVAKHHQMGDFVSQLQSAFESHIDTKSPASSQDLIDPLTARELEVLQLMAQGLTNPEIAARLYLSIHTVKVHTRNIYSKLGTHNRMEAVIRARALGLLPAT